VSGSAALRVLFEPNGQTGAKDPLVMPECEALAPCHRRHLLPFHRI